MCCPDLGSAAVVSAASLHLPQHAAVGRDALQLLLATA
jgi:hypothetical protein